MNSSFAHSLIHHCRALLTAVWHGHGIVILVLPLIASLYYAWTQPVTFDEAWRYLRFTSTPPVITPGQFQGVNHHLFYSLLAGAVDQLPVMLPLFVLRLPSVFGGLLSWSLLYTAIKQRHGVQVALVTAGIASTLFMSVYYSYIATRYIWVILFFLASAIFCWHIITGKRGLYYRAGYVMSCIAGCLLMPSFVLPVLAFAGMFIITGSLTMRQWWQAHMNILIVVVVLYLLIGLHPAVPNLFDMHWARVIPAHLYGKKISSFWYQTLSDITGLLGALLFLFILTAFITVIMRKRWQLLLMMTIFLLVPVLALWMQSVLTSPQTFVYYGCAVAFLVVLPHMEWLSRFPVKLAIVLAIMIQVVLLLFFQQRVHKLDMVYEEFEKAAKQIGGHDKTYFISSELFGATFLYELKQQRYSTRGITQQVPDIAHPISADTISGYDYIVLDKAIDQTTRKQPVFTGDRITVYQ